MPTTFTSDGMLPPGDYPLTFAELRKSLLVVGPVGAGSTWDRAWRARLVDNLEILVRQLWTIGITEIFADGSFCQDKDHPNDIDGYFVCDLEEWATGRLAAKLNLLDPHKVWTWSNSARLPYREYPKKQLPMWHRYRVELWPHCGQVSGIRDRHGYELQFPAAFRQSRLGEHRRGIVKIEKE